MRLDLFLWHARITKTRAQAQAIAHGGHVRIDSRPVSRAAAAVAVGNVLSFVAQERVRAIRIEALPARRGPPAEARACYTDLLAPADAGHGAEHEDVDDDDGGS
ncbi:S4 domain-containing protein [Sphingomonas naphthae]|uniref:S4 domain-containing protein n=1 Tax=Sphingomonas naphthae TaxID=1813468 RepID=A0ABY7TKK1_9SPHN|nr:S4 domain-containing protein [Sphingomonas naphthae]WCT73758.1 S4 domain-containing protein [Sphingomonas naphthae]